MNFNGFNFELFDFLSLFHRILNLFWSEFEVIKDGGPIGRNGIVYELRDGNSRLGTTNHNVVQYQGWKNLPCPKTSWQTATANKHPHPHQDMPCAKWLGILFSSIHSAKETHQLAEANQAKNERLKAAFGISEYFVEGSSFDPDRKAKEEAARQAQELAKKKYA